MIDVDQAPVAGFGLLDPLPRMLGAAAFFRDGNDGEIFGPQAVRTKSCHTDRSKRQPHQDAQVVRKIFFAAQLGEAVQGPRRDWAG